MKKALLFAIPVLCTFAACGHDSMNGPSSVPSVGSAKVSDVSNGDVGETSADTLDTEPFSAALERLGGVTSAAREVSDFSGLSAQADWYLDLLHAPKSGQVFKVNVVGMSPKPEPKFSFSATAPVDIPDGAVLAFFLTAGNRECGLGTISASSIHFGANQPKTINLAQKYLIVGPEACFLDGQNCTRSQCKLPLVTTKVKVVFGSGAQGAAYRNFNLKYTWKR